MKVTELMLIVLIFNATWMILSLTGCWTVAQNENLAGILIGAVAFSGALTAILMVGTGSLVGVIINPIGGAFVLACTAMWTANILTLNGFIHYTNYLPFADLLLIGVGSLLAVIAGYQMQTGGWTSYE